MFDIRSGGMLRVSSNKHIVQKVIDLKQHFRRKKYLDQNNTFPRVTFITLILILMEMPIIYNSILRIPLSYN